MTKLILKKDLFADATEINELYPMHQCITLQRPSLLVHAARYLNYKRRASENRQNLTEALKKEAELEASRCSGQPEYRAKHHVQALANAMQLLSEAKKRNHNIRSMP